jgi:hypothetical protein
MPILLPPINRREFFIGGGALAAGVLTVRWSAAAESHADPHRFALLSDSHVAANPREINRGVNMTDNFRRVVDEVLALDVKPAAAFLNGDCAYLHGLKDDYRQLAPLLDPIRKAGLPLHLGMGNHDDRAQFADVLTDYRPEERPVEGRYVAVIPSERAKWFLLDSLKKTNETPGELGAAQVEWLGKALDAHKKKPAIVVCHHNPVTNPKDLVPPGGLLDTGALFEVLVPRKHVKALIFGHTHDWSITQHRDIHLINLPPTAYLFQKDRPNGWVLADLKDDGMKLTLSALDKHQADHGKAVDLKWR